MENILIHPESNEQLKTVKAVLKALKVQFEVQKPSLPNHIIKSAKKSLKEYEAGNSISLDEFTDKYFINK
ncbi:MAG: hypothetical protein REI64_00360 [Pedobacter sp.]|uniref:DUF2683 family protein n=1 Tax=Pedobacter sp. TaxID=1411316 RepID=UPI002809994A|nr:DUF2683 family protein [Pedobacter sp.]MDQ8003213.1 hypothetical protein [Pedobacter sp.]